MTETAASPDPYTMRKATIDDAPLLARQRMLMFSQTTPVPADDQPALEAAIEDYCRRAMPAGTFHAWIADYDGRPVAGGGLQVRTLVPRPGYARGEPEGLIVSMWTEPEHRRRGLGGRIVRAILEWGVANGVTRISLHASDAGRPVYARAGFVPTNEMRIELEPRRTPDTPPRGPNR